jgi:hypothetical protein
MRFFVTGLPRSRTAWFAVACASGGRVCHHEPSAWVDWEGLRQLWQPEVGVSDSAMGLCLPQVIDAFGPKTLIIERPLDEVVNAAMEFAGRRLPISAALLKEEFAALKGTLEFQHPLIKRVRYADLADIGILAGCFDWLGVKPHMLPQLMHMNVQSDLEYNLQLLRARAA